MLTKDLLNFTTRAKRIIPRFADAEDPSAKESVHALIDLLSRSKGRRMRDVELDLKLVDANPSKFVAGIRKLMLDRCELEDRDGEIFARRWKLLAAAQKMRPTVGSVIELHTKLAEIEHRADEQDPADLYADLPDSKLITGMPETTPEWLVNRYNVAIVQGLLLFARSVDVKLAAADHGALRTFFRHLRFNRLLCEVRSNDPLHVEVSGPLGIFENSQKYGARLSNFFPYILQQPEWSITALIQMGTRELEMRLDHRQGLRSHFSRSKAYVPEELNCLLQSLSENEIKVEPCQTTVNLGDGQYGIPDLLVEHRGHKFFVELFHNWHKHQVAPRLRQLIASGRRDYCLGIHKSVTKDPEVMTLLNSPSLGKDRVFTFSQYPTIKHLKSLGLTGGLEA